MKKVYGGDGGGDGILILMLKNKPQVLAIVTFLTNFAGGGGCIH